MGGAASVPTRLAGALARRAALLDPNRAPTNGFRLVHGSADGFPGLSVDLLAGALLVEQHSSRAGTGALVASLRERFGAETPVFLKERWARELSRKAGRQLHGAPSTEEREVVEHGLRYGVALCRAEHIGLFLDGRAARALVREQAGGRRVLNLFAYTGAFGVAAAAGGARATTNVDLMRSALAVARSNYERNALVFDTRSFLRNDVLQHLAHAGRGRGRYDLVIVDPPPFARCRGGRYFRAREDFPELTGLCVRLLSAGGLLLAGHNLWDLGDSDFAALLRDGARGVGEELEIRASIPPQPDFPIGADRPTARYLLAALR